MIAQLKVYAYATIIIDLAMKKKYLVLVLVLVFTALPAVVHAQQDQTNPERLEREKRISERISRVKPKLTDEQKQAYKISCKGAQTKVAVHLKNAEKFSENHDKKFDEMIDRIDKLAIRLETAGRDVSSVKTALAKAADSNKKIQTAYSSYILALSDTSQVDCQVDPEGFRASIDEAKQEFAQLIKLRVEVRQLIKQDLKTALQSVLGNN